jgi:hypothetical protein
MPLSSRQTVISTRNTPVRYRNRQDGLGSNSDPMSYGGSRVEERTTKDK